MSTNDCKVGSCPGYQIPMLYHTLPMLSIRASCPPVRDGILNSVLLSLMHH